MRSFFNNGNRAGESPDSTHQDGSELNVLVVESDQRFLKKLSSMIRNASLPKDSKSLGLEISAARNLKEAIQTLQNKHFEIILTDISLSDASGFLVLDELLIFGKGTPIVILSNITNWSILMQAAQVGISDFLVKKTLDPGILMRSIFYAIERKKLESKAHNAESLYRSLVEILPFGLARVDTDGHLNYVNQVMTKMAKQTPESMLGRTLNDCFGASKFLRMQQGISNVLKKGKIFETELSSFDPETGEQHIHFLATPIHGEKDQISGAQCILIDITKQKHIQDEMNTARSLNVLQSGISHFAHELNNALTPILLDSLNLRSVSNEQMPEEPIRRIEHSVEKARSVLRPFLFTSQSVGPRSENLDFHKILSTTIKEFQETMPPYIRLEYRNEYEKCSVLGDAILLRKMVTHILNNAVESMLDAGLIRLIVKSETFEETDPRLETLELKSGPYLWLTVSDQGEGIEAPQLHRIFEPYNTTKAHPHKGIGLTETLGIVKGHNGNIRLESRIGLGTEVHLYLPVQKDTSENERFMDPALNDLTTEKRATILLVDDEENILESVQMLIEHLGYDVLLAHNGNEALELFQARKEDIDLVITDYEMPIMSGPQMIQALRQIRPEIKVILFTGLESQESVETLNKLEVDSVLFKPFTPLALQTEIHKHLK